MKITEIYGEKFKKEENHRFIIGWIVFAFSALIFLIGFLLCYFFETRENHLSFMIVGIVCFFFMLSACFFFPMVMLVPIYREKSFLKRIKKMNEAVTLSPIDMKQKGKSITKDGMVFTPLELSIGNERTPEVYLDKRFEKDFLSKKIKTITLLSRYVVAYEYAEDNECLP